MNKGIESRPRSLKRDEMVKSAHDLFYKNGFHATGVDAIMAGTGISKRTLYKHFTSKEGLIIAAIEYYHKIQYQAIIDYLDKYESQMPVEKVLKIFDLLSELVEAGNFNGCFAMNAKTEYLHKAKEIEASSDAYIAAVQLLIEKYLNEGKCLNSKSLAAQVTMLFEGAIIHSKVTCNSQPVKLAKEAARIICSQ